MTGELQSAEPARARANHQLGMLAQARGDYAEAERQYRRSLEVKEELGDRAGMAATQPGSASC